MYNNGERSKTKGMPQEGVAHRDGGGVKEDMMYIAPLCNKWRKKINVNPGLPVKWPLGRCMCVFYFGGPEPT